MRFGRSLLLGLLLLFSGSTVRAEILKYHPSSTLHLGGGYDPARPIENYSRSCIDYTTTRNIDTQGGISTASYRLSTIENRQELYTAVHMSASLDAEFGFFSGSGSASSQSESSFSEDSITWVAEVVLVFGRVQPNDPKPQHEFAFQTAAKIQKQCGTEIVTQETRAVVAAIVFNLTNLSREQKEQLRSAISASASFFSGGGSASASYDQTVKQALRTSRLSIEVEVRGGPGREAIANIVGADSNLTTIRNALQQYIINSNEQNARAIEYETSAISQFYPTVPQVALVSGRDETLIQMYSAYQDLYVAVNRIQQLTRVSARPEDEYLKHFISESKRKDLASVAKQYEAAMALLRIQAKRCVENDNNCKYPDLSDLPRINWPPIPPVPDILWTDVCKIKNIQDPNSGGDITYEAFVVGEEVLFDKIVFVDASVRMPIVTRKYDGGAPNARNKLPVAEQAEFLLESNPPMLECNKYHPDAKNAFRVIETFSAWKANITPEVHFEVFDRFGRINLVTPPIPSIQ